MRTSLPATCLLLGPLAIAACDGSPDPLAPEAELASAKAGAVTVTMTDIRPDGMEAEARAINANGTVVGATVPPGLPGYADGIVWTLVSGTAFTWSPMTAPAAATKSAGIDVNSSGMILGWSNDPESYVFVVAPGGAPVPLPLPDGGSSTSFSAVRIGDGGHVVGLVGFPAEQALRPVVWATTGTSVVSYEVLPVPDSERADSRPRSVNGDGTVVVGYAVWPGRSQFGDPTVWKRTADGWTVQRLELPSGQDRGSATDVNAHGQIAGYGSATSTCFGRAVVWTPRADGTYRMTTLATTGGCAASASAINDRGQLVGTSNDKSGTPTAALWTVSAAGDPLSVRSLGRLKGTYQSGAADLDVGDGGVLRVVGVSVEWPDGVRRATLWTVK